MKNLVKQIHKIKEEHPLKNEVPNKYYDDFTSRFPILKNKLIEQGQLSKVNDLLNNKLQLKQKFLKASYLQNAVETSINIFFSEKYINFEYEAGNKINDKDVDCKIEVDEYTFNIEIKTPDMESLRDLNSNDAINLQLGHRFKDFSHAKSEINKFKNNCKNLNLNTPFDTKELGLALGQKENKLKQYLYETQEKVGELSDCEKKINVLIVSLDTPFDFDNWYQYLFNHQGLFTTSTFANRKLYEEVDIVVFSNTLNYHRNHTSDRFNAWDFENHLSFCFINPLRRLVKENGIMKFINEIIPNSTIDFENFNDETVEIIAWRVLKNMITFKKEYNNIKAFPYRRFRYFYENHIENSYYRNEFDSMYNKIGTIETLMIVTKFIRVLERKKGKIFIDEKYYSNQNI